MKRVYEDANCLPELPWELIQLIIVMIPLPIDGDAYKELVSLRQIHRHLQSSLVGQYKQLIARHASDMACGMATQDNNRGEGTIPIRRSYWLIGEWKPVVTGVVDNQTLLQCLTFCAPTLDHQQAWHLLTRIALGNAWYSLHNGQIYRHRFALDERNVLYQQNYHVANALYYCDKSDGGKVKALSEHSGLKRVTNLTETAMAQFVKSFDAEELAADEHLSSQIATLSQNKMGASKLAAYYDVTRRLRTTGGTANERERALAFGPRHTKPSPSQLLDETVLCLGTECKHIYSDDADMKEFRRTLFHTSAPRNRVAYVYSLHCAIDKLAQFSPKHVEWLQCDAQLK
jgi:hypothetical protein